MSVLVVVASSPLHQAFVFTIPTTIPRLERRWRRATKAGDEPRNAVAYVTHPWPVIHTQRSAGDQISTTLGGSDGLPTMPSGGAQRGRGRSPATLTATTPRTPYHRIAQTGPETTVRRVI
jgi:hypothetical protein